MKPGRLTTVLLLLLTGAALADLTIVSKVEGDGGQAGAITMRIKGERIRLDLGQMSTIVDSSNGDTMTLLHGQKSYVKIPGGSTGGLRERMAAIRGTDGTKPQAAKLNPTGKTERVNGHLAEIYTHDAGGLKGEYWIVKDYPNFRELLREMQKIQKSGLGASAKGLNPDPEDFPGFPIRTRIVREGKTVTSTVESVAQGNLSASEFEPPVDYKVMEVPLPGVR